MIKLTKLLKKDKTQVTLQLEHNKQCAGCKSGCHDGMLNFLFHKHNNNKLIVALDKNHSMQYHLIDEKGFFDKTHQLNDIIGIKYNEKQLLKITLLLYGLPILLMVISLIVGSMVFTQLGLNSDFGGVIGFVVGLFIARLVIKGKKITPKVEFFK